MPLTARQRSFIWAGAAAFWLTAIVAGLYALARYDREPGVAADAHLHWPSDSRLALDRGRPTLVMLAHPRCTCTRASIAELAEIMARAQERPRTYVVFIKPAILPDDWEQSDLWRAAARIPGVTVIRDDEGVEARRFGAETSGQTFLYGADGHLMFSGGTTGARGHQGDNPGRAALISLLNRERTDPGRASIYGCSLFAAADRERALESTPHVSERN